MIGGGLNNVLSTDQAIQNFERNVVWPANQIGQAQVLVGNVSEISGQSSTWSGALNVAANATDALVQGNASAWLYWQSLLVGEAG